MIAQYRLRSSFGNDTSPRYSPHRHDPAKGLRIGGLGLVIAMAAYGGTAQSKVAAEISPEASFSQELLKAEYVVDSSTIDLDFSLPSLVEVPSVLVEELEDALERLVGDLDVLVLGLQLVYVEEAAVEVGDLADEGVEFLASLVGLGAESLVEELEEEVPVERPELVLALC